MCSEPSLVEKKMNIEYDKKDNRFPFFRSNDNFTSISVGHQDDLCELDFVYDKIVDRYPALNADVFYDRIQKINKMDENVDKVKYVKMESDNLLNNIRVLIQDEEFIHSLSDVWGIGIDKVIGTMYSVYGYYFYTGKRTANVIKKAI